MTVLLTETELETLADMRAQATRGQYWVIYDWPAATPVSKSLIVACALNDRTFGKSISRREFE